jgi:hypothetical protein
MSESLCVFCDATGVHDCPGGELGSDYFRWHDEAHPNPRAFSSFSLVAHEWTAPGMMDASFRPKPPDALGISVLSRMPK